MKKNKTKKAKVVEKISNAEENSLLAYMQEINRIPLLSKKEEEATAVLAAKGNKAAKERLVNANLRFVITVAKKYQGKGLPLEDLIGEGNIGLLNAAEHFDVEKGYRFITYAVWWIRQAITKAINEKGRMIRLPGNKTTDLQRIEKIREAVQNQPGWKSEPEIRKIAAFLDMDPEKAADLMKISQYLVSLDDPVSKKENSLAIKDYIEDPFSESPVDLAANSILRDELEAALDGLEERSAEILRFRYGLGDAPSLTLKEIGEHYDLSRERVRQIEKRALRQLSNSSQEGRLLSYIA
ncbi:MAG: RNA polymerase sigma factor RpoD/SigA [Treponema sp.]|nr:RNA polymerase sigma factor RpoD/SigA [Treponema sp.]